MWTCIPHVSKSPLETSSKHLRIDPDGFAHLILSIEHEDGSSVSVRVPRETLSSAIMPFIDK